MMRQMRENTKWIMLVTALAFVALMVFEWGMDMTGRSAGGVGEIGRVNGSPVMYDDYMASYRSLYDRVQASQDEPVTTQRNREIEDAAFDDVVTRILVQQELDRRGIQVTDEEVISAARTSPPPEFRQLPAFQTEGQFDLQKYQQFLASPQADQQTLLYLESYYRDLIPRGKLMRQVTSGLYLTDQELWRRWKEERESVQIQYVPMNPGQSIPDAEVEVSPEEIETYYEDHEEDFRVPARARVRAVVLNRAPTPADTAAALERAREARQRIVDGEPFADVAATAGDPAAAVGGGELGVVRPQSLLSPLDSVVLALDEGELSDPVQSQFGYHVLQVQERWGVDSVQARQVLVPVERTEDSEIALLTMADSLEDLSENRPLEEAAGILGVEIQEAEISEDLPLIPGAGQVGEGSDWAFEDAAPGDVSPVFENAQAFYALELVSSTPAGILPLQEVRSSIEETLRMEEKIERAESRARDLVERMRTSSMASVASEEGLQIRSAGPFARTDFVPGLGRQNAAVGAAFGLDVGEVGDPVTASQNVFIIQTLARTPADSAAWREQLPAQRQAALAGMQQQRIQEWLEGLRASARIVDRRDEVLQSPGEEQPLRSTGPLGF